MMVVVGGGAMVGLCCHNDGCHHFEVVLFSWMGAKGRRKKLRVATWN